MQRFTAWRRALTVGAVAVTLLLAGGGGAVTAQPAYEPITGSGSTWSQNALDQWVQDVRTRGMTVSYSGIGSSAGRRAFAQGQNDFGVSEIPYQGTDRGQPDNSDNRAYAYMPIVAGGTSFMYHLRVGGQLYRGLRLSGETIAKIFTGAIRNWSDPAITRDNNGRALPSKPIIPIVRGDGSGTTAQFTRWMDIEHRNIWRGYCRCEELTSYYPVNKGRAPLMTSQTGSDRVAGAVSAAAGDGSITYVEYSFATARNFPVAKVLNAGGYYTEPTHFNVAVALTQAQINNNPRDQDYLTQVLDRVYRFDDPRTYPLSSYSYAIIPVEGRGDHRITAGKGRTMSDFMYYFLCQGQRAMPALGYSPLPANLVRAGFDQVKRIPHATIQDTDVARCGNPTFDPGDPTSNKLAREAPMPPACDRVGQGPCAPGGGGGGGAGGGGGGGNAAGGGGNGGGGNGGAGGNGNGGGGDGEVQRDPETGLPIGAEGDTGDGSTLAGSATELAAFRSDGMTTLLGALVGVQLLLVLLVPPFVARAARRRRDAAE
ncbi:phosphate ABC transporter substrate-binding protein PstS [Actinophytocola gossypii]|uniref:Phosphate ABC transporter substrate-binding protein PstS n=1 Tax=Actinophytocola gossypii TaxID=2812003 RepID=A0ABT2J8U1_9PSEU|nr:phosphate ABC transporter substrate-binding protein PstS [Actinophytocola gossypii]MCT2584285.1 phosphate ABC transporter substrate-binding protein PstS [Actinophytocola gossypii]